MSSDNFLMRSNEFTSIFNEIRVNCLDIHQKWPAEISRYRSLMNMTSVEFMNKEQSSLIIESISGMINNTELPAQVHN